METLARKVLVGIDFSELGDRALKTAISLAAAAGGKTEVHAAYIESVVEGTPVSRKDVHRMDDDVSRVRERVQQILSSYKEEHGDPAVAEIAVHVARGAAAQELAHLAAQLRAGLIVVGTHGRRGIRRAVLGSVAESLVRIATCPVLVMRAIDHSRVEELPDVAPLCQACAKTRDESEGKQLWCEQHAAHHPRAHVYGYAGPSNSAARAWASSTEQRLTRDHPAKPTENSTRGNHPSPSRPSANEGSLGSSFPESACCTPTPKERRKPLA